MQVCIDLTFYLANCCVFWFANLTSALFFGMQIIISLKRVFKFICASKVFNFNLKDF